MFVRLPLDIFLKILRHPSRKTSQSDVSHFATEYMRTITQMSTNDSANTQLNSELFGELVSHVIEVKPVDALCCLGLTIRFKHETFQKVSREVVLRHFEETQLDDLALIPDHGAVCDLLDN